mmetsp:Transcript_8824/g.29192  ORF Transcript_8824/g.29192 Transcript_8824/m.29192 type:complete len:493 (+) Transcript_8824:174-1652(+)
MATRAMSMARDVPFKVPDGVPPIGIGALAPAPRVAFPNITDWRPSGSPVLRYSLEVITAAFAAHGYVEVPMEWKTNEDGTVEGQWDVMWSYHYPFRMFFKEMKQLKPHQRVNHFPGPGAYFTNKTVLASHFKEIACIPTAFQLPHQHAEYLEYSKENLDTMWVVKSAGHRGVKVVTPDQVPADASQVFVQEYVKDALLIDNHRFDMGVYVAITSLNPLKVFVYDDALMRFCIKEYDAANFKPEDLDTYVIGDKYTPPWDMPSLSPMYDRGLTTKQAITAYWAKHGVDGKKLFENLHAAIADVLIKFEPGVFRSNVVFPGPRNRYFELFRFDFVFDKQLRPWLMECNMSPNLSAAKTAGLRSMFQRIAYDLLSLAGLGNLDRTAPISSLERRTSYQKYNHMLEPGPELCNPADRGQCNCEDTLQACHVCSYCTAGPMRTALLAAAAEEHLNKRGFIRVKMEPSAFKDKETIPKNRMLHHWYKSKCETDAAWCQ